MVIPFVGAGLSCPTLPSWWSLLDQVYRRTAHMRRQSGAALRRQTSSLAVGGAGAAVATAASSAGVGAAAGTGAAAAAGDAGGAGAPAAPAPAPEAADTFEALFERCGRDLAVCTEVMIEDFPRGAFAAEVRAVFNDIFLAKAVAVVAQPKTVRSAGEWLHREMMEIDEAEAARLAALPDAEIVAELTARARRLSGSSVRNILANSPAQNGWAGLAGQKALVTGPWHCVVTTNWDSLLEMAWEGLQMGEVSSGVSPENLRRGTERIPVRYRQDVTQLFAELRAGTHAPRLFKLHGDLSDRGQGEFVSSHADYRKLMLRDVPCLHFLRHLSANYSLMFYGYSLSDKDLLASLDDMVEAFGGSVGPHFWITADNVSPDKARYLLKHYAVHTVRVPIGAFGTQLRLLERLCRQGFTLPRQLKFHGTSYDVDVPGPAGREPSLVTVRVTKMDVPDGVLARLRGLQEDEHAALGLSVGAFNDGAVRCGIMFLRMLGDSDAAEHIYQMLSPFDRTKATWRAEPLPEVAMARLHEDQPITRALRSLWTVNGQVTSFPVGTGLEERQAMLRRSVFVATRHFLANAIEHATGIAMPRGDAVHEGHESLWGAPSAETLAKVHAVRAAAAGDLESRTLRSVASMSREHAARGFVDDAHPPAPAASAEVPPPSAAPAPTPPAGAAPSATTGAAAGSAAGAAAGAAAGTASGAAGSAAGAADSGGAGAASGGRAAGGAARRRIRSVRRFLPVLSAGIGMLREHEAFLAQLSSIGAFVADLQSARLADLPRIEIVVCLWDAALTADIEAARVRVGACLGRALEGWVKFNALYKDPTEGWTSKMVRVPMRGTRLVDLTDVLGVSVGVRGSGARLLPRATHIEARSTLLEAGCTEGSLLVLDHAPSARGGHAGPRAGGGGGGGGGGAGGGDGGGGARYPASMSIDRGPV